jgi:hypothetical protein
VALSFKVAVPSFIIFLEGKVKINGKYKLKGQKIRAPERG